MVAALEDFIEGNELLRRYYRLLTVRQQTHRISRSSTRLDFNPEQSLRFGADAAVAEVVLPAQTALPRACALRSDCGSRCDAQSSLPGCRLARDLLREHRLERPSRLHRLRH